MWTKCIQDTEMAYVILTKPFIQNLDYTGKIILKRKKGPQVSHSGLELAM